MKQKNNIEVDDLDFRKKSLEVTFAQIHKQYGKGSVMLLGDAPVAEIKSISTGSLLIDEAIGVNGLPCGRIVEVFGPESSGKTTLALQTIAQAQLAGGVCAFIDAEHALDPKYAEKLGVNINDLIISQPDFGEQALDIAEMLVRSNAVDVIVIDSVAALVPKAELEGEMGDTHVGLQARLMSQALRKLASIVHKSNTILLFINQIRQTISGLSFGPKETTSGGKALKFYASVRLDIRKIASLKKNDVHFGNRVVVKVVKNKVAAPFKSVEIDLLFNEGMSKELELLDMAIARNIIKQSGSWFSFGDTKLAQGREQVLALFKEDTKLFREILGKVKETIKLV
ncbi:recombinase RecA [Candidatus Babeliales bacterium]|nr:recombinase RecA [Candidatus Babeliales bacterium]MBP9843934.1 recombinase RecA [Candidatus Babeliales bacterium]